MKKRMIIMLSAVSALFLFIFVFKFLKAMLIEHYIEKSSAPAITVTTTEAKYADWLPEIKAVGSVRATLGVNVTTELAGMVQTIYFKPGADVAKGDLLVQLNIDTDVAQLHSLEANQQLAQTTYNRDKAQYDVQAVSKQTLENDAATLKSAIAQVAEQKGVIAKKTIRAPFSGRLGISNVNPGQYVNPGDKIVMLQTLDPIYVDFYVPQQSIAQLKVGQAATATTDAFPGKIFTGQITTIDPALDVNTRNIQVEATFANSNYELLPGLFTTVSVVTGKPKPYLTLPQTAVSFNPYGEIVFIVQQKETDKKEAPVLTVQQSFVTTGDKRGDQVVILKGLKEGQTVVSSGQLKLKNGSVVSINNKQQPSNEMAPQTVDE